MAREQGIVVSFSRGYGFVTTAADLQDTEAPRYFFHASQVQGNVSALRQGIPITFEIATSDRADGKSLAVNIRDANDGPIVFTRDPKVNMNVSAPGRRVAVAERSTKDDATFCFAIDQEQGERVFVPMPLLRGQTFEYTLEPTDKGPKAVDITGPMGTPLQRPNNFGRGRGGNFGGRGFGGGRGGFNPNYNGGYQQQGYNNYAPHNGMGGRYNGAPQQQYGAPQQQYGAPQQMGAPM